MKKKLFITLLSLVCAICCLFGLAACNGGNSSNNPNDDNNKPDDGNDNRLVVVENIEYVLNDDGQSYYAYRLRHDATSYTVVSSIEGLPVTKVGDDLFARRESAKTVIIEEGIREIGKRAFWRSQSLETLVIPSSVTTFGEEAFGVGNAFYEDATKPTSLTAPAGVLPIIETKNLKTLVIDGGDEITYKLLYAKKLRSVEIRNGITAIGVGAFRGCDALESISIPDSVKTIGEGAFGAGENLKYNEKDGAKYLGNTDNPHLVLAGVDDKSITGFDFEDGTKILYGAFNGCKYLESVDIPSDITCIGGRAFGGCKSLTSLEIPSAVASVGEYTFLSCNAIVAYCEATEKPNGWDANWSNRTDTRNVQDFCPVVWNCETNKADGDGYIYETIDDLRYKLKDGEAIVACQPIRLRYDETEDDLFDGHITIPDTVTYNDENYTVTEVGERAFLECENVVSVFIENGVERIGDRAFESCNGLTRVNIPDSIVCIAGKAFYDCNSLISVEIPLGVTEVGKYAFYNRNGLTIYCRASARPKGWKDNWYESVYTYNRTSVVWNCGETDRDANGYAYAVVNGVRYQLKNGTATVIGQPRNIITASILSTVTYDSDSYNVTTIDQHAFNGCNMLTSVSIPHSVTNIGDGIFAGCNNLTSITVDKTNEKYMSAGNCLIYKTDGTLLAGCKTSVIPSDGNVLRIGNGAFSGSDITEIAIPNSVTYIGSSAFSGCTGLTEIVIPDSVTEIASGAFYYCTGLTSVTLSNSLTTLGSGVFRNCYGLTSIRLPASITDLDQSVFKNCKTLLDIYYDGTKAEWDAVNKDYWDSDMGNYVIHCSDGDISKH